MPRLTPLLRIISHVLLGWRVRNAGTIQTDAGLECEIDQGSQRLEFNLTPKVGTAEIHVSSPLPLNALINAVAEKSEALKISILRP